MAKTPGKSNARTKYLKLLGNPYASLQVVDPACAEEAPEHLTGQLFADESSPDIAAAPPVATKVGTLSKKEFRERCRRIFEQYIPAMEQGKLRDHQRDFINRNELSSPAIRYALFAELKKYDLSSVSGLKGQFNREYDAFTDEKLKQIESAVNRGRK